MPMDKSSEVSGFYKKPVEDRLKFIKEYANLTDEEVATLQNTGGLPLGTADRMIENVIGGLTLPMGLGVNFRINGKDVLIPMVIEEPSVVAAASNAAKMARPNGGFTASFSGPVMIAQVQLVEAPDPEQARKAILERRQAILDICNKQDPMLIQAGGGARDIEVRVIQTIKGPMV